MRVAPGGIELPASRLKTWRPNRYTTGPSGKSRVRSAESSAAGSADQQLQQRLLGVQAVLGLVEDGRALAVEDSAVISSPGWAGRQCRTIARSEAASSSASSTR